jgi:hypothetical protein
VLTRNAKDDPTLRVATRAELVRPSGLGVDKPEVQGFWQQPEQREPPPFLRDRDVDRDDHLLQGHRGGIGGHR